MKLQTDAQFYQNLVNNARDIFSVIGFDGTILYQSPSLETIFGYKPEEIIGESLFKYLHPEEVDFILGVLKDGIYTGSTKLIELRFRHKDGSYRRLEAFANFEIDKDYITVNSREITKRYEMETALKESENAYRSLFQTANDAVFILDPEKETVLEANNKAFELYGYERHEFLGLKLENIVYNISTARERIKTIMASPEPHTMSSVHLNKNREKFQIQLTASIIHYNGKECLLCINRNLTEIMLIEEALRISDERFRLASMATNDAIWDLDLLKNKLYWGDGYTKIFGYKVTEEETHLETWQRHIYHEDTERVLKSFTKAIENGESNWSDRYRFIAQNGEIKYICDKGYILYDESGTPVRMVGAMQDITELEKASEELRESEEKYRSFVSQSSDGIFRIELEKPISIKLDNEEQLKQIYKYGYLAECNEAFANMYGIKNVEAIINKPLIELHGQDSNTRNIESIRYFINNEYRVKNIETEEVDIAGNKLYILNNCVGIIENGFLIRFWGTQTDISEQKKVQSLIKKLSSALEQSPHSVTIVNNKGVIEYANPNYSQVHHDDSPSGKKYLLDNSENILPEEQKKFNDSIANGTKYYLEHSAAVDGNEKWYRISVTPIINDDTTISHSIIIQEDITDRKAFEVKLFEAKEKAEHANKIKSQFLANISHEIRTPLNGIIGMTDLMFTTPLEEDQQEFLQMIKFSSDNLLKLIEEILDLSRIEAKSFTLNNAPFCLTKLINNSYNLAAPAAAAKHLDLTLSNELSCPYKVYGDDLRISQIISNLLNNSIKFTEKGYIQLSVSETFLENNVINLKIQVSDSGIGIHPDKIEHIFEKFTQIDNGFKKSYGGAGLGLSIVKNLVDMMNGDIKVISAPQRGSTFICAIPLQLQSTNEVLKAG